jgi:hypothetical protein
MKVRIIIVIFSFVIEFLLISELTYYNVFAGLIAVILLLSSLIVYLILRFLKNIKLVKTKQYISSMTLGLLIGGILGFPVHRILIIKNEKNADLIIASLKGYHKDFKVYPYDLKQLKPKYLKSIPIHWCGLKPDTFRYELSSDSHNFMLTIRYNLDDEKIFRSEYNYWDYYD